MGLNGFDEAVKGFRSFSVRNDRPHLGTVHNVTGTSNVANDNVAPLRRVAAA